MNITNLDLNLLVVFDTLYVERNVTRTADRLALTQPTVSGMIKRLRHVFKDQLFVRTSHGVVPTPRADELAGPVREVLLRIDKLVAPQQFDPETTERTFHICCNDYMQVTVIQPLFEKVRQLTSSIKISVIPLQSFDLAERLSRGEIDLYLTTRKLALSQFELQSLHTDKYVCVARQEHPFDKSLIPNREICSFDHILVSPSGDGLIGPIDSVLESLGLHRNVAFAVPTFSALIRTLTLDDFLAFMPMRLLPVTQNKLRVFTTEFEIPPIEIVANWHRRFDSDLGHQWLRNLIVETVGTYAPMEANN